MLFLFYFNNIKLIFKQENFNLQNGKTKRNLGGETGTSASKHHIAAIIIKLINGLRLL